MKEEIFGPVLTLYVYDDADFEATLRLIDQTTEYALTGRSYIYDIIISINDSLILDLSSMFVLFLHRFGL